MMTRQQPPGQKGFTIIELLIATTVLSTILLLVTAVMINIGKLYYKGINQSRVQNNVRSITADLGDNLRFSEAAPQSGSQNFGGVVVNAYCVGPVRYSYVLDAQINNKQYNNASSPVLQHVLWRDIIGATTGCAPANLTNAVPNNATQPGTNGQELIAPNSRLTALSVTPASPYTVAVGVAYGADDLINHSGGSSTCLGGAGDQFCSTAFLSTVVVQRLTDNSF